MNGASGHGLQNDSYSRNDSGSKLKIANETNHIRITFIYDVLSVHSGYIECDGFIINAL